MDELPPRARALLDVARGTDEPSRAERSRIDGKVRATLAGFGLALPPLDPAAPTASAASSATEAASSASGGAAATGAAASSSGPLTFAAGAASMVAVGLGALWVLSGDPEPAAAPPPSLAAPSVVEAAAADDTADDLAAVAVPTEATPLPAPTAQAATAGVEREASAARTQRVRARRRTTEPAALPHGDLQLEVLLIDAANRALSAGRHGQALGVLAEHAERFPAGELREERRALRVLALCGAGRLEEGRRDRERLLAGAADSVLAARLRDACQPAP